MKKRKSNQKVVTIQNMGSCCTPNPSAEQVKVVTKQVSCCGTVVKTTKVDDNSGGCC